MRKNYEVRLRNGATLIAFDMGTGVQFRPKPATVTPLGFEPWFRIPKQGWEMAGNAIRREFPGASIYPVVEVVR